MSKVDLYKSSSLPITYLNEELSFDSLDVEQTAAIKLADMSSQILNSDIESPEIFYKKYVQIDSAGIFKEKNLRYNIYLLEPNLAGVEFVKTKSCKVKGFPKILEVLHGGGTIILQQTMRGDIRDLILSKVKAGQKIIVPPNYSISISNTRQTPLIVGEVYCGDARHKFTLDEYVGMSYYIIKKNAKLETVRNSNYRDIPKPRKVNWDTVAESFNITLKTPILKQIMRKYDKFKWLTKKDKLPHKI